MADFSLLSDMAMQLGDAMFMIIGGLIFIGICGGLAYLFMQNKKYDIIVRMYSKRKNGWKTWTDKGAFIKNVKTGDVYGFKLKKEKDILQPPPYEILMMSMKGNILHMQQESSGEFYYLDMTIEDPRTIDEKGKVVAARLKIIEGDIQLWMTNMIDKLYTLYQKKKAWEVWLPYAIIAVSGMVAFLIIYFLVKKFDVLQGVASSLSEAATQVKEAAIVLKEARASGALISS